MADARPLTAWAVLLVVPIAAVLAGGLIATVLVLVRRHTTPSTRPDDRRPARRSGLGWPIRRGDRPGRTATGPATEDPPPAPPQRRQPPPPPPPPPPPSPPRPTVAPAPAPLTLWDSGRGSDEEPPLPSLVTIGCAYHGTFFHGTDGRADGHGKVRVRGTALRGLSHERDGREGQDAVGACWDVRRNALYLAVADGLGSTPDAGRAARTAVRMALQLGQAREEGLDFAVWGPTCYDRVAAELRRGDARGATTLILAELALGNDGTVVTAYGVGDSELWLLAGGEWTPLHHERDPSGGNATRELPSHPAPRCSRADVGPGSVLVAATDGFASALSTDGSPLAKELAGRWRTPPPVLDFVSHVGFRDDYFSDDRGVVAAWID